MYLSVAGINSLNICCRSLTLAALTALVLGGPATVATPAETVLNLPPSSNTFVTFFPEGARLSERLYNLPGLSNVGRMAPGVFRGAQPSVEGYATLKKMGIKTVIDLRTTENEKAKVEAAGMKAIAVPIAMSHDGLKEKVDRVVSLMADPANQPVFVHCRHGQDRTGIVVAAYRMKVGKWSLADAETEMQAFGFNNIWINFKKFIHQYPTH